MLTQDIPDALYGTSTNTCDRCMNTFTDKCKLMLKQVTGEVKNMFVKHNEISTLRTSYEVMETILLYVFSHLLLLH